jgi:hypothetical protein
MIFFSDTNKERMNEVNGVNTEVKDNLIKSNEIKSNEKITDKKLIKQHMKLFSCELKCKFPIQTRKRPNVF